MRTLGDAKKAFEPQKLDQGQTMRVLKVGKIFQSMCEDVFDLIPECPDRTAGLRLLLQAKWTLTQAISHGSLAAPPPLEKEKKNAKKENEVD